VGPGQKGETVKQALARSSGAILTK
jgi:hypothetical protein